MPGAEGRRHQHADVLAIQLSLLVPAQQWHNTCQHLGVVSVPQACRLAHTIAADTRLRCQAATCTTTHMHLPQHLRQHFVGHLDDACGVDCDDGAALVADHAVIANLHRARAHTTVSGWLQEHGEECAHASAAPYTSYQVGSATHLDVSCLALLKLLLLLCLGIVARSTPRVVLHSVTKHSTVQRGSVCGAQQVQG